MYNNLNDLMKAENKKREKNQMSLIFNCIIDRNAVYGEIKGRNPVKIGFKKNGKYHLFNK